MEQGLLQVGIIGGGMIAQAHMKNFVDDPRTSLRWLAEINPQALAASAEKFTVPKTTADYRDMLADPALDLIVVCTPPSTHVPMGIEILRAGKHLIMEKPMALSVEEGRKLVEEMQAHPQLKVTGCSARHARLQPKFPFVKALIDEGKLGRIYYIHHRAVARQGRGGIEYNPGAKWFLNKAIAGGGPLYDWGVYDLSFHLGLVGEPELLDVQSFCINGLDQVDTGADVFTVEEHGAAMMTFEGGLRYYWERASNAHAEIPNQTTIYGTKGGLRFGFCSWDSPEVEFFYVDDDGKGKAVSETLTVDMTGHPDDMPAFGKAAIDYFCGEGPVPMPLELELKNLDIMLTMYAAARW